MLYHSSYRSTFNLKALSRVRNIMFGVAALLIVLYHSPDLSFAFLKWDPLIRICETARAYSHVGVDIFLFFSGVGLYFSLSHDTSIKAFYKKRLMRILPAVLIVSFTYNALIPQRNGIVGYFANSLLLSFFINGSRTFWYFSFIIVLYAIYPLLHKVVESYHTGGIIALLALAVAINVTGMVFFPSYYTNVEIALGRIPVFLCGIWIGSFVLNGKEVSKTIILCVSAAVFTLTFVAVMLFNDTLKEYSFINRLIYCPAASAISVMFAALFERFRLSVLRKLLITIGVYSMEIYLLYEKVIQFSKDVFYTDSYYICFYTSAFIVTIVLSVVLHIICAELLSAFKRSS